MALLDEGCFQRCLVSDSVILKPHRIGRNVKEVILAKLCETFEGVCSRHGFILPGSVRLHRSSPGSLEGANLNGDVRYDLQYHAMVCNPAIGSVISARVMNKSRFGFLLHSGASPAKGGNAVAPLSSIVETVVSKQATYSDLASDGNAGDEDVKTKHVVDLEAIQIGDVVNVRVMGKKFHLNDRHIFIVGRIVERAPDRPPHLVPVIGDNNEEDLSVIAATEVSADERDDHGDGDGVRKVVVEDSGDEETDDDEGSIELAVTDDEEDVQHGEGKGKGKAKGKKGRKLGSSDESDDGSQDSASSASSASTAGVKKRHAITKGARKAKGGGTSSVIAVNGRKVSGDTDADESGALSDEDDEDEEEDEEDDEEEDEEEDGEEEEGPTDDAMSGGHASDDDEM